MDSFNSPTTKPLYRGVQIVWYVVGIIEVILAFRFILKLLGANASAGFTAFIYVLSHPFVAPFISVFHTTDIAGSVFEWTTLLAILVYWIIGYGLASLFVMGRTVSTPEAALKLREQETS